MLRVFQVDEEVAKRQPVWVINYAEISYSDIPNFVKNERVKNKNYFCSKSQSSKIAGITPTNPPIKTEIDDYIYTLYLGQFSSHKQYDSWIAGGSEFKITMGVPTYKEDANGVLQRGTDSIHYATVSLTREEINQKKEVNVNAILCSEWKFYMEDAGFLIVEEDGGGRQSIPFKLSANYKGVVLSAELDLGACMQDEKIYKITYTKRFLFSSNNTGWHSSGYPGVHWTLPYKKGFVIEDFRNK